MTDDEPSLSRRDIAATAILVFLVAFAGFSAAFALWLEDLYAPQITVLGSGDRLSIMVTEGPARLILATGDDAIGYENALTRVRPLFARRVDVLLVGGSGDSLLAPLAADGDAHARVTSAIGPIPPSPESAAFGAFAPEPGHRRFKLGRTVSVTVESRFAFGSDPAVDAPAWRAIVERGDTRVVVLSDGAAASLFPPASPASVLVISGDDPAAGWPLSPAAAIVANAGATSGPEFRSTLTDFARPPAWGFRVFPGEALRMRFVQGGIELPSESAHRLG